MKKVTMYTLSTCPWCRKTKQYFKDKRIDFEFIDYDMVDGSGQDRIVEDMKKYTQHMAFPFVKIGDKAVVGFNPEKYEELLK
jgi:glutaredoxin